MVTGMAAVPGFSRAMRVLKNALVAPSARYRVNGDAVPPCAVWFTVNALPPTLMLPDRDFVPVLVEANSTTLPLPVPDVLPVNEIHSALLTAVHAQSLTVVVTLTEEAPPSGTSVADEGSRVKVQGIPACVSV